MNIFYSWQSTTTFYPSSIFIPPWFYHAILPNSSYWPRQRALEIKHLPSSSTTCRISPWTYCCQHPLPEQHCWMTKSDAWTNYVVPSPYSVGLDSKYGLLPFSMLCASRIISHMPPPMLLHSNFTLDHVHLPSTSISLVAVFSPISQVKDQPN